MFSGKLEDMTRGWFVGNFTPSLYRTKEVEVAVKSYRKGDMEQAHYHKIATELTVVVSGRVEMFGRIWKAGDIVVVQPGETTGFKALEDSVNVVVKLPGAADDKFLAEEEVC